LLELVPIDAETFSLTLTKLRHQHGESKEAAATRIGVGVRHYVKWTGQSPPSPRISSIAKVAKAYGMTPGEFMAEMDADSATFNDRLRRIEDGLGEIRDLLRALVPVVAEGEAAQTLLDRLDRADGSTAGTPEPNGKTTQAA
jgi:transcriptional regulator with XRE-family HTH domain